jgi:transposase
LEDKDLACDKKGAQEQNAALIFLDESGFSLKPSVRRTWAPRGKPPVLRHHFNWKRINAIGAIACRPDGSHCDLLLRLQAQPVTAQSVIGFLSSLRADRCGQPTVLLWDGLPAHRSLAVRDFLAEQRDWLKVERFPAYAPELNPIEYVWSSIKGKHIANLCAESTVELDDAVTEGARTIGESETILQGCLLKSGLYQHAGMLSG